MADYHPLIARAVAGLDKNSGENRRALYERARVALVAQLRGVVPALDESEITRERLSLEEAIRKVEAEAARQAREAVRPPLPRRTELPRREEPARRDEAPAREEPRREELRGREEPPRSARGSVTPDTPASPRPARPQDAPPLPEGPSPPPRPPAGPRRPSPDGGLRGFHDSSNPADAAAEPHSPEPRAPLPRETPRRDIWTPPSEQNPPSSSQPPPPSAPSPPERHPLEEFGQLEPQLQAENLWALPLDGAPAETPVDLDTQSHVARHPARGEPDEHLPPPGPPRSYGAIIRIGLVLTLILAVAGLLVWQGTNIVNMAGNLASGVMALFQPSSAPPREAAAPARPKITDRIGQPSTQSSGPAVAPRAGL